VKFSFQRPALTICLTYLIIGCLWILFSGLILDSLIGDKQMLNRLEVAKGWIFITVTAVMLYFLITRYTAKLIHKEQHLLSSNEELTAAYEEVTAMEEELRQQCDELLANDEQLRHHNEYLNLLHKTSLALMSRLSSEDLLSSIVSTAIAFGKSQYGFISLLTADESYMELKIRIGLDMSELGYRQKKGEGIVGKVWETQQPLVIRNYHQWSYRLPFTNFDVARTSIGIPLKSDGKIIGVFGMNYTEDREISTSELTFLQSFAELASLALDHARLYQSVQADLWERRKIEQALQASESHTRALIEAYPDFVLRLDHTGTILWLKAARDFQIALPAEELLIGRNIGDFLPETLTDRILYYVEETWQSKKNQSFEFEIMIDNQLRYREMRFVSCLPGDILAIVRDITDRKQMEQQLRYIGLHDPVTGLYNRLYFEEEMLRLEDCRQCPVGLIVCDLDGLKLVNDTLGHSQGDALLKATAHVIRSCFRASDVVARIGGDEFAILMPLSDLATTEQACQRIRNASTEYSLSNPLIPISISVGMAIKSDPAVPMNAVFKEADNNMYREKLHHSQSNRSAIVQTLATAMEARDFITDGHADRLQDIVADMGDSLGLTASTISDLRLLARFHDIGKVGVPDHILFKSGKLTTEEYTIMQRHSEIGYRIAQSSPDLTPIADWILKHHERWDGQGYPLGLAADDIPLACRILGIADAYDAMTNDRPYRQAMTCQEAIAEIRHCSGSQFDPQLVEIFITIIENN
jgi:diguanylate cyclase (GGDEF)-like protein/PAS domain S-box-containing protein